MSLDVAFAVGCISRSKWPMMGSGRSKRTKGVRNRLGASYDSPSVPRPAVQCYRCPPAILTDLLFITLLCCGDPNGDSTTYSAVQPLASRLLLLVGEGIEHVYPLPPATALMVYSLCYFFDAAVALLVCGLSQDAWVQQDQWWSRCPIAAVGVYGLSQDGRYHWHASVLAILSQGVDAFQCR